MKLAIFVERWKIMKISEALKKLISNPDDLTTLPQLVAQVEAMEQSDFAYQERIQKLQDINKSYLAQIPIPNADPTANTKTEDKEPTLDDAREAILQALGGNE
jgi:hypothetical protein